MHKLAVLLPTDIAQADSDHLQCWQIAADGSVQLLSLTVTEIAKTQASHVTVVLPVTMLSWHEVVLPVGVKPQGDTRLQAVLHSLLEDALLEDVEQMHLALQPHAQAGQPVLVAACHKAWLGGWLQAMERAGIKVGRIVPQASPDMLQTFSVCTEHAHSAWLSTCQQGLPLSVPINSEISAVQAVSTCYALPSTYKEAAQRLGADKVHLWSETEAVQWMLGSQWDMAQHAFASNTLDRFRRQWSSGWQSVLNAPHWRSARYASIALAVVMVVGLNAHLWMQQRVLHNKRAAVVQIAQTTFPHLQIVVDAPLQMQREVDGLRHAAGVQSVSDFQPLAAAAGAALRASGLAVSEVEFSDGALLLRGLGAAPQQLQALNQHLQKASYMAEAVGDAISVRALP